MKGFWEISSMFFFVWSTEAPSRACPTEKDKSLFILSLSHFEFVFKERAGEINFIWWNRPHELSVEFYLQLTWFSLLYKNIHTRDTRRIRNGAGQSYKCNWILEAFFSYNILIETSAKVSSCVLKVFSSVKIRNSWEGEEDRIEVV